MFAKMFRTLQILSLLLIVFVALPQFGCSSSGGEDDGPAQYQPSDQDSTTTDGDQAQTDGDISNLPLCADVCPAYCDKLKTCDSTLPNEDYIKCKENCEEYANSGQYPKLIGCVDFPDCRSFLDCKSRGGNSDFDCRTGNETSDGDATDGDVTDGDNVQTDGDDDTTEVVERPEGYCESEVYCAEGTHCDPISNTCLPECDPLWPLCESGEVCSVITSPDTGTLGSAVCVSAAPDKKSEGESCVSHQDCQPQMICGGARRCEVVCDPTADDNECGEGLRCQTGQLASVATCSFCYAGNECGIGLQCVDGRCGQGVPCDSANDCGDREACMHGYCVDGCQQTGCTNGTCDNTTGLCQANICPNGCAAGECCNRSTCGPCCSGGCATGKTCDYDPSCYPEMYCCVDRIDCRDKPIGYCGNVPCNRETGSCLGVCPMSCPWLYECSEWTNFQCKPVTPNSCSIGEFCQFPCFACDLGGTGYCLPTPSCTNATCLSEKLACTNSPGFMGCCQPMVCARGESGSNVCCPPEYLHDGICEFPADNAGDPYTCPECNPMKGTYCKSTSGSCPTLADTYVVNRDSYYPCYFIVYKDSSLDWNNRIAELTTCESGTVIELEDTGTYDECRLFWDNENTRFTVTCKKGSESCQNHFLKSACQ